MGLRGWALGVELPLAALLCEVVPTLRTSGRHDLSGDILGILLLWVPLPLIRTRRYDLFIVGFRTQSIITLTPYSSTRFIGCLFCFGDT